MARVLVLGSGGHAAVVVEALRLSGHQVAGTVVAANDDASPVADDVPVLGDERELARLRAEGIDHAIIGFGCVRPTPARRLAYERAVAAGFSMISAIHPAAVVASSASIGAGTLIGPLAVINPRARVGRNAIVNTGAIVEHDAHVGHDVHIAPGAVVGGGSVVEDGAMVGAGAMLGEGRRIGAGAMLAMGAVAVRDVSAGAVALGVPARERAP
jgi:UDP-perosamine 4-acetyltransferase